MIQRLIATVSIFCCSFLSVIQAAPRASQWSLAEQKSKNAVVQVHAHYAHFDWLEPYKAPKQEEGSGTAFFIDGAGHLLTNFHVVEGAKTVKLSLPTLGKNELNAFVIGVCPEADVALLKVSDEDLSFIRASLKKVPFLTVGDADHLYPTEPVLALGYPMGTRVLKSTVGVLAGLREPFGNSFRMHITAPINPGNSGGPLLNLDGAVVGINSAGIPGAQSIGYTIPINDISILLGDLRTHLFVRKPYPGCHINQTTDEHARALGNPLPAGVYINAVEKNSLAHKLGIRPGDMLYAINGCSVDSYGDITVKWPGSFKVSLHEYFVRLRSKSPLKIEIYRNGQKKIVNGHHTVVDPQPLRYIYADYEPQAIDYEIVGGACFMQLRHNHLDFFKNDPSLQRYRLPSASSKEVLIVTKLLPGSLLHKLDCIYEGALLQEVNGVKVKTLAQLRAALQDSIKTGVISLKMKHDAMTVISLDDIFTDENRITKDFMFSTTPGMKRLRDFHGKNKRNA
ncbi:trypsin-like peptidase domain-containing protein [Candidatus Dependentiae bacterium]|nr:trypsin-like peptidase domain-containing protein [Candidatus Dependentiae bacterium]